MRFFVSHAYSTAGISFPFSRVFQRYVSHSLLMDESPLASDRPAGVQWSP